MLKTGIFKSLTIMPSFSSFFSAWSPDLKNVISEKIRWAHYEVRGKEIFSNITVLNQCILAKKMSYVLALRSKFSLNLSTEEEWLLMSLNLNWFKSYAYWNVFPKMLHWKSKPTQLCKNNPKLNLWRQIGLFYHALDWVRFSNPTRLKSLDYIE